MCFLCRFVLIFEFSGLLVFLTVEAADRLRNVGERRIAESHAVRTHVGYVAVLIKLLRDLHRSPNAVTEFSRGLLLQRRGSKGRGRSTFAGFDANVGDRVVSSDAF